MSAPRSPTSLVTALPLVGLALSGFAGLIYEVVWTRAVATLFGSVVSASGLLLALFMGGLGAGSALGARWASRCRRPLFAFGAVELAVGSLALVTPFALRAVTPLVARLDAGLPDQLAPLVPAALSLAILGPIVVLLGATFPLFMAHAAPGPDRVGEVSGRVYGINTVGAVVGTLAAGFVLLPTLGIRSSLIVAASADLAVGTLCVALGRARGRELPLPLAASRERSSTRDERRAVAIACLGGAAALILEVAWFRALVLIFGSSVYAMSLMLAAFLVGLVTGSLALAGRGDSTADRAGLLGRYHVLVAFSATLVTVALQLVPGLYIPLLSLSGGSFAAVTGGSVVIIVALLVVPTTCMGAALPLAIRFAIADRAEQAEGPAGRVYAASSLGSCLGALAAGFVLVPGLGLRAAVFTAVTLSLAAAGLATLATADRAVRRLGVQAGALTLALWLVWAAGLFPWDWRILTAGYYAYAHLYSGDRASADGPLVRQPVLDHSYSFAASGSGAAAGPAVARPTAATDAEAQLLHWEEGRLAQVAVVEEAGVRSLLINGKADASNGPGDMRTQLLLGHLPVLLAPRAPGGRAMVIGLGSGVTAGAVASWPFADITVAEIEPAVVRASRWFAIENRGVLDDPRVRVRVDDARRVLQRFPGDLTLITSEPSNLWMSGVSLLFTREFFALAALRLGEDGVLCQWLHLYQVGPDDVRTLIRTLSGPFPHLLAFGDGSDLLLVASRSPLVLDPATWQQRLAANPEAASALARSGIGSGIDLAGGFLADEHGLLAWAAGAPLHTDDHPVLEFTAARRMASDLSEPIRAAMVRAGEAAGSIRLGRAGRVGGG